MTPCPCLCQALPSASFPDATVPLPLCPAAEQAEALAMPCHILQEELQEPTAQVMRPPQPKAGALPRQQLCVNHNDEETPPTLELFSCTPKQDVFVSVVSWSLRPQGSEL